MDAAGRRLPGAVKTVVREEFGVSGYILHVNYFQEVIPVYGRRITDGFRFSAANCSASVSPSNGDQLATARGAESGQGGSGPQIYHIGLSTETRPLPLTVLNWPAAVCLCLPYRICLINSCGASTCHLVGN